MELSVEALREEYLSRYAPLSPTMNSSMRYKSTRYPQNLDRFIPNRSAMDFDYAHYMLTEGRKKGKENLKPGLRPPSREAYQKLLAATFNMNRTRILAFKDKPPTPVTCISDFPYLCPSRIVKPLRHIPHKHERILDASGLIDDFHLNLLDWGSHGILAIALTNSVICWDPKNDSTSVDDFADELGPITSISWSPDGQLMAIGLSNSRVEIWDFISYKKLRTLKCGRNSHVGSLVWNNDILTTGGTNGKVLNNDLRMRSPIVQTYKGHRQEVCGLKWSDEGQHLASGGKDNRVHIWDKAKASSNSPTQWLHRLQDHTAAVRALSWCPYQRNLLASGGGEGDHSIKFWNTKTGSCLNSIDTGSEVCALLWNKNEHELLSSHGLSQNQLALWRYPSMVKMAELTGHTSRVLYMAQNPKDGTVASAAGAGDERLMTWNIFPTLENVKPTPKVDFEPFAAINRIR